MTKKEQIYNILIELVKDKFEGVNKHEIRFVIDGYAQRIVDLDKETITTIKEDKRQLDNSLSMKASPSTSPNGGTKC